MKTPTHNYAIQEIMTNMPSHWGHPLAISWTTCQVVPQSKVSGIPVIGHLKGEQPLPTPVLKAICRDPELSSPDIVRLFEVHKNDETVARTFDLLRELSAPFNPSGISNEEL